MLIVKSSPLPILLTIPSPPLKGAGGMLIVKSSPLPVLLTVTSFYPVDRYISPFEGGWGDVKYLPFEGSPRAGAAEYVQGGMLIAKSPNRQIAKSPNRQIGKLAN